METKNSDQSGYLLESLPLESIKIYAARNALRVLPLAIDPNQLREFSEERRSYLAASISIAAAIGLLSKFGRQQHDRVSADAIYAANVVANVANGVAGVAHGAAEAAEAAARSTAHDAADSIVDTAVGAARSASNAAAAAAHAGTAAAAAPNDPATEAKVAVDIANAAEFAARSATNAAHSDVSAADAAKYDLAKLMDELPLNDAPLWPDGSVPKHLNKIISQWKSTMSNLGLSDHAKAYEKILHGKKDAEKMYLKLIKEWMTRGDRAMPADSAIDKNMDLSGPLTIKAELAAKQDHLGRKRLVEAIAELLTHPAHTEPLTIGLLGDWGAGKTTVLNLLGERLKESQSVDYHVQIFNAWSYEHTDNIQAGVAQEAVEGLASREPVAGLKASLRDARKKLKLAWNLNSRLNPAKLYGYSVILAGWLVIILYLTFASRIGAVWRIGIGTSLSILFFIRAIKPLLAHPFASEFKTYLNLPDYSKSMGELPVFQAQLNVLADLCLNDNKRLLFVVDDLDRCSPEGIVKVFEAIRLVMELKHITVIIAIDHRIALSALAHHYQHLADEDQAGLEHNAQTRDKYDIARDYLGKIIQLPINLDRPDNAAVDSYISHLFEGVLHEQVIENISPEESSSTSPEVESERNTNTPDENNSILEQHHSQRGPSDAELNIADTSLAQSKEPEQSSINYTMQHSVAEREKFQELAELMRFHNPRQLKRLHSSYRLLRTYQLTDETTNLHNMAGLFWFEYLYGMKCNKRKEAEKALRLSLNSKSKIAEEMAEEIKPFVGLFIDAEDYSSTKQLVEPFVLPQAQQ